MDDRNKKNEEDIKKQEKAKPKGKAVSSDQGQGSQPPKRSAKTAKTAKSAGSQPQGRSSKTAKAAKTSNAASAQNTAAKKPAAKKTASKAASNSAEDKGSRKKQSQVKQTSASKTEDVGGRGTSRSAKAAKASTAADKSTASTANDKSGKASRSSDRKKLRVIPIGGLHEIGKNMTLLEYGDDIMVIDCGMAFPDDEMLGVDVVIPDFSYLVENSHRVRGVIITHGHEDHIGAVPYLLKKLNVPIYGTRLTIGFIKNKLKEHQITGNLNEIYPGDIIKLGCFSVETIHTTHSVADALALCITTPVGKVFHTGDFKIDYTPVDGEPINFGRLARIGEEGVLLLMADSTNAGRKGYTASEKTVGIALGNIFRGNPHRIIIATFSSNVHRVQKIVDMAVENGRKIAISGRSMENMASIATELGYLNIPANSLVDIKHIKNIKDSELIIITTGSQGEPMSALARMANNEHRAVQIRPGDVVILSSTPVPGNEKTVSNVVNALLEKGADVIYNDIADTHVSGHACAEELKLMHTLIKPKFFMPVHGEYKHLKSHATIAESLGMDSSRIFFAENGNVLEFTKDKGKVTQETVPCQGVMVDGYGVGDVGSSVLNERKYLSEAGLVIISASFDVKTGEIFQGPQLISKGFVYVKENEDLMKQATVLMEEQLMYALDSTKDAAAIKTAMRDSLRNFIYRKTKRSPVIIPIFFCD